MQIQLIILTIIIVFSSSCGFKASLLDITTSELPSGDEPVATPPPSSPLTVEVNQRSTQGDPTSSLPIEFVIDFSEQIVPSEFTPADLQVTGTASGMTFNIINSGDNKSFLVQVVAVTTPGQINISVPSGSVTSLSGISNLNAASDDPSVTYQVPSGGAPYMLKNIASNGRGTSFSDLSSGFNFLMVNYDDYNLGTRDVVINLANKNVADNTSFIPNLEHIKKHAIYFGELSGFHYYVYDDGVSGSELWKSNGTAAGTTLVKDINPGSSDTYFIGSFVSNRKSTVFNGYVYFVADVGGLEQIWRSDGTSGGTQSVIDLSPTDSVVEQYKILGEINGRFYFIGKESSTYGVELYWSSGTDYNLIDIRSGSVDGIHYSVFSADIFQGDLIFTCVKGFDPILCRLKPDHTWEYIISCPDSNNCASYAGVIGMNKNYIFYKADTTIGGIEYGRELWASDGTISGNIFLGDINPTGDSFFMPFLNTDLTNSDVFYFMKGITNTSTLEVWASDGTLTGTTLIKDLHESAGWPWDVIGDTWYESAFLIQDKFIFAAQTSSAGVELWVTEGTLATTQILKDIFPGTGNGLDNIGNDYDEYFAVINNKLIFKAQSSASNFEIWSTDGTNAGTQILKEIYFGTAYGSDPADFQVVSGVVYFTANSVEYGTEIWETDGTTTNTKMFYDLTQIEEGAEPGKFVTLNNTLFYSATIGYSKNLYSFSSSTGDGGIFKTFRADGDSAVNFQSVLGSYLFFTAHDSNENRDGLWISDGTLAGTTLLSSVLGENSAGVFGNFYKASSMMYFISSDDVLSNSRLWKSDGTSASMVNSSIVYNLLGQGVTKGDEVLTYSTNSTGRRVIRYSPDGDSLIQHAMNTTVNLSASDFFATTDTFFFVATDDSNDRELYRTDGPSVPVKLNLNATGSSEIIPLATVGSDYYFMADIGTGVFLYKANSSSVTQIEQISDVYATTEDTIYTKPIVWNSKVYFTANDGTHGYELWVTDGTSGGTEMVKDIQVGSASGDPYSFFVYNNKLYFTADDGVRGYEIYESDGTSSGTVLKFEILAGAASAYPFGFYEYNGKIYFTADDGVHGFELWVMDLD